MNTDVTIKQEINKRISTIIAENKIVLFMKGNELYPSCGYSGLVVKILTELECDFKTVDVLEDFDIRQGIKDFSDWQTIPQLYVKGEFIGGCDIINEMYKSGELQKIIKDE